MVADKLSEKTRSAIKVSLGIRKSSSKATCSNCFYRPIEKICNKHHIKTQDNETCDYYKRDTKFKFISGGRMSPR
ncbi:hypothetical protein [Anoxybacteroides tepidamans]|uniref:hypothetical protein n=1 Tax=Anoxybacteroides tepidamans TaxID=265948 RepID=UPI000483B003|nr:hypothetical protein [Anoxybacillus tepidamans]